MDPQKAQEVLAAHLKPGSLLRRVRSAGGVLDTLLGRALPTDLQKLLEQALAIETPYGRRQHLAGQPIGALFATLDDGARRRLIAVLLPPLAPSVEAAWQAMARRPYQSSASRLPFRCPRSQGTTVQVRGTWLLDLAFLLGDYDQDVRWVAAWGAHLAGWSGADEIGWLLAGAIDAGGAEGDEVLEILKASAAGEHEIGQMGRHVTRALLCCSRPDAWAFVERLLLAAQRQEGLRQVILETVDEAHPEAFRRVLRLVLDENLARFSSVVRAFDTWFGFLWDGASAVAVDDVLGRVLRFLDDASAREAALGGDRAEEVYLALWCTAFEDVDTAVALAVPLLDHPAAETRFAAVHLLVQAHWSSAPPALVRTLGDPDLRVAARALDAFSGDVTKWVDGPTLFAALESLIGRLPKRAQAVEPILWPWTGRKLERTAVAGAMAANAEKLPAARMLPWLRDLDTYRREALLRQMAGLPARWSGVAPPRRKPLAGEVRAAVLDLLGDASADVRAAAFEAVAGAPPAQDETDRLVELLARKASDLRGLALGRLRILPDARLLACADRLLADADELRGGAGLELLRDMAESRRSVAAARERAAGYRASHSSPSAAEQAHLDALLGAQEEGVSRDDALGLVDPRSLRAWPAPAPSRVELDTPAARRALESLAERVTAHERTEVRTKSGETKLLLEAARWSPWPGAPAQVEGAEPLPREEVWRDWLGTRPADTRDADGLELLRVLLAPQTSPVRSGPATKRVVGTQPWSLAWTFLELVTRWCLVWQAPEEGDRLLVDGLETSLAGLTSSDFAAIAADIARGAHGYWSPQALQEKAPPYARKIHAAQQFLQGLRWWRKVLPASVTPDQAVRAYGLQRWFQERSGGFPALEIVFADFVGARRAGQADAAELIHLLAGPWSSHPRPGLLGELSGRKPPPEILGDPELTEAVERCRRRVVEVESRRGDREGPASALAVKLRDSGGLDTLSAALPALGKTPFARAGNWRASGESRQATLSHLVLRSSPREADTPEAFAAWASRARLRENRLVELAVYAPQWARHVNHVLGWPGLESAVWWVQAHTKDDRAWDLRELKDEWAAEVNERTPLSARDLTEGAVDVEWFHDAYARLGAERWQIVDAAAKYASSAGGHTRARLLAQAMTGGVGVDPLLERIAASRHQDTVRALGLVPLAGGDEARRDLLRRYRRLQEFRRESRKFGSQRQQSERRAADIAMANLARTAGYRDPQRLQWAMEREAVADLAHGSVSVERGDLRITLSIDADGAAELSAARAGKPLKALPAAVKDDPEVAELKDRLQELRRQRSRVRRALEEAMCRGDRFTGAELRELLGHPILAPALSRLVFVGDDTAGYPAESGLALRDAAGGLRPLGADEPVRIAHPADLLERGGWSAWQRECFAAERVQPFKQVFRELYPVAAAESGADRTRRYAGHQIQPRQALALLGGRGWVAHPEEGVNRTFHEAGLTARLGFQEAFYTPADIEGLTLEEVVFTCGGDWTAVPLAEVPARVFSEAMRDLDLVVSVAHRGTVDPEASASTVEMRAGLLRETCALLGLDNVEVQANHAIIRGALGTYSVHLGSAGAQVLPGAALFIVAVHSQHRGRLFLPFADDDPRTAEVLSKVLLLARDRKIQDPGILDQIRCAGVTS
jgi:hypothetical protein